MYLVSDENLHSLHARALLCACPADDVPPAYLATQYSGQVWQFVAPPQMTPSKHDDGLAYAASNVCVCVCMYVRTFRMCMNAHGTNI